MSLLLGEDEVTANGHLDAADLMVTSGAAAPNGVTNGELVVTSSGQEYIVVVTDGGAGVAAQGQKEHGLQYVEQEEFQVGTKRIFLSRFIYAMKFERMLNLEFNL